MSLTCSHWQAYCPYPKLYIGGVILTGEDRRTWRKTCAIVTLSTTNPTWTDPGANPGLLGERLVTNHLRHSMAHLMWYCWWLGHCHHVCTHPHLAVVSAVSMSVGEKDGRHMQLTARFWRTCETIKTVNIKAWYFFHRIWRISHILFRATAVDQQMSDATRHSGDFWAGAAPQRHHLTQRVPQSVSSHCIWTGSAVMLHSNWRANSNKFNGDTAFRFVCTLAVSVCPYFFLLLKDLLRYSSMQSQWSRPTF
jgi:hypothetical protein